MLEIENLTKLYGTLKAVDRLSLHVEPGEIYGFLGPNGAGKTSTIKIVAGLLRPTSGRVLVDGRDVTSDSGETRRLVGYVSDEPHPYERLTGREFLLTMGALFGIEPAERQRRLEEALGLFELGAWADELTESYSHGMKQKLMVAAALMHRPKLIVADEPLVGLDPKSAIRLKLLFRRHADAGGCILLATHILETAEKFCDRVGIILEGKLAAEGTVAQLRERVSAPGMSLESIFMTLTGGEEEARLLKET